MWSLVVGLLMVVPSTPPPTVEVAAECSSLVITTNGWPEGSDGIVGFGSGPPQAAPVNDSWSYAPAEVAADQAWFVLVRGPGMADQSFAGTVHDCGPVGSTDAPDPVWMSPPMIDYTAAPWAGIELAPPW